MRWTTCHRGLKPENILLDWHMKVRVSNFGFARWMPADIASTSCGTHHYTAPETFRGCPYDGHLECRHHLVYDARGASTV
jgi:serine/threonine protein kinase